MSAALCYIAVMLETQSMHAVVSNLVKQYRYCSLVLLVHVQCTPVDLVLLVPVRLYNNSVDLVDLPVHL